MGQILIYASMYISFVTIKINNFLYSFIMEYYFLSTGE